MSQGLEQLREQAAHAYHEDLDYYEGRAYGLRASAQDGTAGAVAAFERCNAPLTQAGARAVVARAHGFASWAALRRHVATLHDGGEPFARAYRAIESHDVDALREQLCCASARAEFVTIP